MIDRRVLSARTNHAPDGLRLSKDIDAVDECRARIGLDQGGERLDGGGLSGAVGTQESRDAALLNLEVEPVALRIEAAHADIEQEVNRAKETLRTQVSTLVIAGAERVLEDSIDASKHEDMIKRLAAEL